jgi:hypothetical protein
MDSKTKLTALMLGMFVVLFAGCQSGSQTQQTDSSNAGGSTAASATKTVARRETITVPAGTTLAVRLVDAMDTGKTTQGSTFEATLAGPLAVNGVEVAAVGSTVTGQVTNVVSSGRLNRPAELSLTLTSLTPRGGEKVAISTNTRSMKGESHKKRDIEMMGGGTAGGALIGALAGGKKGALIGGLVGGGGGTGVAAATGKKEIRLPSETKLSFTLSEGVTLPLHR